MSGIDECIRDIPECPICGHKPGYWTINVDRQPTLWLFSEKYLTEEYYAFSKDSSLRGEGKYRRLTQEKKMFDSATCMGGCGNLIEAEEYPEEFSIFDRMFQMYFPEAIRNTD